MAAAEASPSTEPKVLTDEEITECNGNGKLYVIIHGKVVDLTSYMNDHPYVLQYTRAFVRFTVPITDGGCLLQRRRGSSS